jgi:hypothetical protein
MLGKDFYMFRKDFYMFRKEFYTFKHSFYMYRKEVSNLLSFIKVQFILKNECGNKLF